ncbi:MAG TPA: SpvB/TcaC N-terminal domain-containing protein, partial [Cyclobacteriaceae bacterium]|nr:SpvB/TcaC N-terminal domain-containing protein [Cyclobacteriaceae bacterium]
MKNTLRLISITFLLLVEFYLPAFSTEKLPKPVAGLLQYPATSKEGLIGITPDSPIDNPADNIFHIIINETICNDKQVWLEYELDGVEDHTAVSRSVNDQRSVGGYFVKVRRGWALQREQLNADWLKKGDNIIRFTMPEGAAHSYRVRNLKVVVASESEEASGFSNRIVINQPESRMYFDNKAYFKGFVVGDEGIDYIKANGEKLIPFNGEFEGVINFDNASCKVDLEIAYENGTTQCQQVEFSERQLANYQYAIGSNTYRTNQFFERNGTGTLSLKGASIKIDKDALSASSNLSITTLRDVDIAALDAGMVNVTAGHYGYRFLPNGTQFLKESEIKIPFDLNKIPDGYTEKDIKTYYFDEQVHHWIEVPVDTVLLEAGEIISKTTHFTDYINAIIKVPESPEVEAYNSTSMKGIKAANPTAAVNLINPPQANNTGGAAISYPINIPAGRGGMQPQLAISYNSGGGNGWLGLGWNLTIPSVGIETRWGVPRYNSEKETETYNMNGEQLTPLAHRSELVNRSTGDKQFYPRVEGAFNKIIRHGNNPANYYWEVTDKSGTKYFYGGTASGFDKNSVLRTNEANDGGNVAQWCLSEVRDLNGNTVKYHYLKKEDKGLVSGTVPGHQIYIDKIKYTGHNGSDGPYEVIFTRETGRPDKMIMANFGFKQVTGDLLKKIEVRFDGRNIRSYELTYQQGAFSKTLLKSIAEFDVAGNKFNEHSFEYYDDVAAAGTYLKGSSQWAVPDDNVQGNFKTNVSGFRDESTALSGTKSKDKTLGFAVSVGTGLNVFTKKLSAGVSGGYSESESDGLLTMMDMNGDGLQDKVFVKNGKLKYRQNLLSKTGEDKFDTQAIDIEGIDAFYYDKSKTKSYGAEAQFGGFVGYSHSKTTSKTTIYFTEANGDQLPDIVKNGVVYFNHLDPETGVIRYTPTSEGTPSRIFSAGSISNDLLDRQALEAARQLEIDQNPLLDMVRMWKAPYSGKINITAPVQLLNSLDPKKDETPRDGVRVAIQLRGTELWHKDIGANDYSVHYPSSVQNLTVNKGDFLFFRVGSHDNGSYDSVRWKPEIEYVVDPGQDINDANGNKVYKFSAEDDYILSSAQTVTPPFNGQIQITGDLMKPQTTDDLHLVIIRQEEESTEIDTVWQQHYAWNRQVTDFPDTTIAVKDNELYSFKVLSATNIDWNSFTWKPHLIYQSADDPSLDLSQTRIE